MHKNDTLIATFAILVATLFWGMTFAFIKDAVSTLNPFIFLFWRFGIASALLMILFFNKFTFNQSILLYGIVLGLLLAGTVIFQTIGLQYTTASTASFITGLSVILVALFESIGRRTWPSKQLVAATIVAFIGIAIITLGNGLDINRGDIWVLLCAFCFANYIIVAGVASKRCPPLSITWIQSLVVCFIAGIIGSILTTPTIPSTLNVWVAILFCSIFASIIAFLLQLKYQQYISATKAAIIFSLEPVFATITAAFYLDEQISLRFAIGAFMILFAIMLSEKRNDQKVIPQE